MVLASNRPRFAGGAHVRPASNTPQVVPSTAVPGGLIGTPIEQRVAMATVKDFEASVRRQEQPSAQSSERSTSALNQFLALYTPDSSTHDFYECYLTKSIPPLQLTSTTAQIQDFIDYGCGKKDIKPGGRKAYFRAIRCFFNWAYSPASDLGLKPSDNPITWVKAPKVSRKIMPAQSKESIEVLLSHVDNVRDQAIICLLTDSGSRLAGIADVSEPDIDWDKHLIKIITKGGDEAFIPFGRGTEILIREWLSEYNPNGGSIWGINKSGIVSMLRRLENSSGVKCNAHTFRRGFASILRRNNVDSLDIMRLGGWKSLTMVQTYTESVSFDDSLEHYKSPIQRPTDATDGPPEKADGLSEKEEVPRPRIELGTRGFSVRCSTN